MNSSQFSLNILKATFPTMLLPLLTLLALVILLLLIKKYLYGRTLNILSGAGIGDIDRMDGKTFEKYLEAIYRNKGYAVKRTPYRGDFGGDLILEKDGVKVAVQAKRWKKKVGVKAIQEIVAAKGYYGCHKAMVISNADFTEQASALAKRNSVTLIGRQKLLDEFVAFAEGRGKGRVRPLKAGAAVCFTCGKVLTPKEIAYCLKFKESFKGQMLCYGCQRKVNLNASTA